MSENEDATIRSLSGENNLIVTQLDAIGNENQMLLDVPGQQLRGALRHDLGCRTLVHIDSDRGLG